MTERTTWHDQDLEVQGLATPIKHIMNRHLIHLIWFAIIMAIGFHLLMLLVWLGSLKLEKEHAQIRFSTSFDYNE